MGKKGKVNKLARMSDEERARYLQHRADMEEEARRRKRELIARFIKNKLDKEETYSRMNTAKLNQGWRYVLRNIKCSQMANDIQGMMTSFNFMLERKNRLLNALTRAIEEADEQHRRAFQTHTETLSYFISIGSQRLSKLQTEYDHQKIMLLENWDKEELDISDSQEKAEFKLKLIIYIQERDFNNYKKERDTERATTKNDFRLEHEEEMRSLWRPKQLEIEWYWGQLRDVYSSYLEQHHPILGHYNTLKEKDEFYHRDIARNEVQIQQATELLFNLQKEWLTTTSTMACKLQRMNGRKEELARRYWQMKREAKCERSRESSRLEIMVNASQDAITRLAKMKEKLDKIKLIAEICSKYETVEDNAAHKQKDQDVALTMVSDFDSLDSDMINECKEYRKLEKFMLKMNRVRVQTICLRAEKGKLAKENLQIKQYIKRYLTELALKDGKEGRPLSVKIQSSVQKIEASGRVLNRPVTCIEGALSNAVMHEKRMKSMEKRNQEHAVRAYPRVQCWMKAA